MIGGTCICGASTGCDGMHHCPGMGKFPQFHALDQMATKDTEIIAAKDAELSALRARCALLEKALEKIDERTGFYLANPESMKAVIDDCATVARAALAPVNP